MHKISQPVLAFLGAQGRTPAFVNVSELAESSISELPNGIFADAGNRGYPLHTKSAAWLSAASIYGEQAAVDELVENRLVKAAAAHGIAAEVAELKEIFEAARTEALTKSASAGVAKEDTWALTREDGTCAYLIKSAGTVVRAAEGLTRDLLEGRLDAGEAASAAQRICKRAAELSVPASELPYRIQRLGSDASVNYPGAVVVASLRKEAGYTPEAADMLMQLLKSAGDGAITSDEVLDAWSNLDKHFNVSYRNEATPHEALHTGPSDTHLIKQANDCLVLGGVLLPREALTPALDERKLARLAPSEADCLTKLAGMVVNEGNGAMASVLAANVPMPVARRLLDFLVTARAA